MLKKLHIKNFKAWADTGPIRMAPITVFFGTNSSGKTSLHQFLMLLKQTAASQDRRRVLHLGDKSTSVDLGAGGIVKSCGSSRNRLGGILLRFIGIGCGHEAIDEGDPRSDEG